MKKTVLLLLTALALFLLASCGGEKSGPSDTDTGKPETPSDTADLAETAETADTDSGAAAGLIGDALVGDFINRVRDDPDISAEALAGALLTNDVIDFAGTVMTMEPGYFMGIELDEVTGFEEAARFSPIIGSIPFMGYVFRLGSSADAKEFSALLMEHADLGWNICTFADRKISASEGDHVFFLMYEA